MDGKGTERTRFPRGLHAEVWRCSKLSSGRAKGGGGREGRPAPGPGARNQTFTHNDSLSTSSLRSTVAEVFSSSSSFPLTLTLTAPAPSPLRSLEGKLREAPPAARSRSDPSRRETDPSRAAPRSFFLTVPAPGHATCCLLEHFHMPPVSRASRGKTESS